MSFLHSFSKFAKSAVSTAVHVADTVSATCKAAQPLLDMLPVAEEVGAVALLDEDEVSDMDSVKSASGTDHYSKGILVGLVRFDTVNSLLTESLNLKRLETFLTFLGNQSPSTALDKSPTTIHQVIWLHNVLTLLAEVAYQQRILLTTSLTTTSPSNLKTYASYISDATNKFNSLSRVYGGFAHDLTLTVGQLGIITEFQRAGVQSEYTPEVLGRSDTWSFSKINIDDTHIQHFIDSWNEYFTSTYNGKFAENLKSSQ